MTVIVAARTADNDGVMACDSLVSLGPQAVLHDAPKMWVEGQYVIGAAGSLRTAQVVRHHVSWPKWRPDEDTDIEEFLVTKLVPAIQDGIDGHGVITTHAGKLTFDCSLLIAFGPHIAALYGDFGVACERDGRMAIGSGTPEALGLLGHIGPWEPDDVTAAVRASIRNDRGCGFPVVTANTRDLALIELEG